MANQQPTPPSEASLHESNIRKRVGKACDRCRLKKSKCDGGSPCSRCKSDNAICVYGERKKSHDKVYPKGYVEMLEQQQAQLVTGLQELYKRTTSGEGWEGSPLKDSNQGHPLTHDILERLGALHQEQQGSAEPFEEDTSVLQQRLYENGATPMYRHQSVSSDSDHGGLSQYESTPASTFTNPFEMGRAPPTPPTSTPYPPQIPAQANFRHSAQFFHPAQVSASMNPAHLQRQSWAAASSNFLEDQMDFVSKFQSPTAYDLTTHNMVRQSMPMTGTGPCLVPELNEDEEFKSFLNQTVV